MKIVFCDFCKFAIIYFLFFFFFYENSKSKKNNFLKYALSLFYVFIPTNRNIYFSALL